MNLLKLAVLLKAKEEYEKSYGKKKTKLSKGADKVVYSSKEETYLSLLLRELSLDNSNLYVFFKKIYDTSEKIKKEYYDIRNEQYKILDTKKEQKKKEIEKALEEIPCNYSWVFKSLYFDIEKETIFAMSSNEYDSNNPEKTYKTFLNEISHKIICISKEIENLGINLANSKKRIEKLNKLNKLFFLKKIKESISVEISKEEKNIKLFETMDKLKKFQKFYIENKEKLISFFVKYGEYENSVNELDNYGKTRKSLYNLQNEVFAQALEAVIREENMTPESLQKVFLEMDKVEIKGRRGAYKDVYHKQFELENLVKWFIENVYETDEMFVKRNYNLSDTDEEPKNSKKL